MQSPSSGPDRRQDDGRADAHHHDHAISPTSDQRYLAIALALIIGFMIAEIIAGILSTSLVLISDAGHMLTDAGALVLAMVSMRLARRPAKGIMTYGLKRSEILSAQINGTTLLVLAAIFVVEGVQRLIHPPVVKAGIVLVMGLVGIIVNLLATMSLARANRTNLNVRGSFRHIATDLAAFIATAIAGAVMYFTRSLYRLDAAAAFLVAILMAWAGYGLVRDALRVLLEAAPKGMHPEAVRSLLLSQADVVDIEDLHVWEITSGFPAMSAHLLVREGVDCHVTRRVLAERLAATFGITHSTLQIDHIAGGHV